MIVFCHGKAFAVEVLNEKNGSVYSLKYFENCMEKIQEDTSEDQVNIPVIRNKSLLNQRSSFMQKILLIIAKETYPLHLNLYDNFLSLS